jgi:Domain of unknown function (DUF1937)
MIYLASPYSDPDPFIRDQRYLAACRATVQLLLTGQTVFSPIVNGHGLVPFGLPTDWPFWARHGERYIARSDELLVLAMPGWEESVGVQAEIEIARRLGKVVRYHPESSLPGRDVCATSQSIPEIGPLANLGNPKRTPLERNDQ